MNYTNLDQKFVFTFILGQLLNNKQIIPRRLTQQGVKLLELKTRENYNLYLPICLLKLLTRNLSCVDSGKIKIVKNRIIL